MLHFFEALFHKKPQILAIATGIMFPLTCFISYGLAIALGHMEFSITYVSDSATYPPVSSIFGFLLTLNVFIAGLAAYARYLLVIQASMANPELGTHRVLQFNRISTWLFVLAVWGMVGVGHFQVDTSMVAHAVAALGSIACTVVYFCMQVVCSNAMVPTYTHKAMLKFRFFLAVLSVVTYIVGFSAGFIAFLNYTGTEMHRWRVTEAGYTAHAVSSVCEWILGLIFSAYFMSYADELRFMEIQPAKALLLKTQVKMADSSCSV